MKSLNDRVYTLADYFDKVDSEKLNASTGENATTRVTPIVN